MEASYALGRYTAAALRSAPRHRAELVSQLLFGEPVSVIEPGKVFSRVRCSDDEFEGYVRNDQLLPVDDLTFRRQRDNPAFALDLFSTVMGERHGVPVTFGARLAGYDGLRLRHGGEAFHYSGQAVLSQDLRAEAKLLLRFARRWLYVPELTGGRTPTGVDGAGLVQLLARLVNLRLPRTAEAMSTHGRDVDFVVQCQPADLAFFDGGNNRLGHVGILLPGNRILHVDDRVRIDAVDHFGIFNLESKRYTHRLRIVRRHFPDQPEQEALVARLDDEQKEADAQLAFTL